MYNELYKIMKFLKLYIVVEKMGFTNPANTD